MAVEAEVLRLPSSFAKSAQDQSGSLRMTTQPWAALHGEDDAELGFATGHAVPGFVDFVQREFFDHGAAAGVLGEAEGVFRVDGTS